MAIINVTQKNFSKVISEQIDNLSAEGLLLSSLFGGKEKLKEKVADTPDENLLWVNTDHVAAASGLIKTAETGEVVFRIFFKQPDKEDTPIWIKGDDYKRFILAWAGKVECINVGEYEIPSGYRAVVDNDYNKIRVEKIQEESV